jgi:hypothetical protein
MLAAASGAMEGMDDDKKDEAPQGADLSAFDAPPPGDNKDGAEEDLYA